MAPDKGTLDELKINRPSRPMAGAPRSATIAAIVALALAAAGAVWWLNRTKAVPVRTAVARQAPQGAASTLLDASGYVTARREATVSSKVTGPVLEVLVEEGMRVTEGQVLARIDSVEYRGEPAPCGGAAGVGAPGAGRDCGFPRPCAKDAPPDRAS